MAMQVGITSFNAAYSYSKRGGFPPPCPYLSPPRGSVALKRKRESSMVLTSILLLLIISPNHT